MSSLSRGQALASRRRFFLCLGICLAIIVAAHLAPKSRRFADPARLFWTMSFFSATGLLGLQLLGPRRRAAESHYQWRYADAPTPVETAWRKYLYAQDQLISTAVWLGLALLISVALMILARWFPWLRGFAMLYNGLWWVAIVSLALYPLLGGYLFSESFQRYRALRELTETCTSFRPRSLSARDDAAQEAAPLRIEADGCFRAGGIRWGWNDFRYNCIVFGMPGSGKTSCVLNALLEGMIAAQDQARETPAGLILDPKGDFRDKIQILCGKYGRQRDLVVIDPHDPARSARWNPLDCDDDELELAGRFTAVLESLGMDAGENTFWIDAARRFIRHSIALLRFTNPPGQPPNFCDLQALVSRFDEIASRTDRLDVTNPAVEPCLAFFREWIEMAPNQRSGIQSHVANMLDPFLMEPYASMFSGRSTQRIADMVRQGSILYVHMPIADKQVMARTIGSFIKLEYYREVLKSLNKRRPTFFLCDEFQQFFTTGNQSGDADFFERSRQSNHANLIATQNLPGLCRQSSRREPVSNLLGNCATKILLRNADEETNEYASKLFGEEIMALGGAAGAQHGGRGIAGRMISQNDQFVRRVSPDVFKDLATPDQQASVACCESLAFLGSRAEGTRDVRKLRWPLHLITNSRSAV